MPTNAPSTPALAAPAQPAERHELIDIVRGFALFGVLFANMLWTTQYFAVSYEQRSAFPTAPIDDIVSFGATVFIHHKFYTLFSMLFGLGFAMQLARATKRGSSAIPTYCRRLTVLLVIGVAHAVLLWFGDILHIYALCGLLLLLFRNISDRTLVGWMLGLATFTILTPALHLLLGASDPPDIEEIEAARGAARLALMTSGQYLEVIALNWSVQLTDYTDLTLRPDGILHWYFNVLWKFLLGFYIGRKLILQEAPKHVALFKSALPGLLVVGLAGNLFTAISVSFFGIWYPDQSSALVLFWIPIEASIVALSLAYLCVLALMHQRAGARRLIQPLAPVGRMALTNYLTHSVLFVLLFMGVGMNLIGRIGATVCLLLALIIFGVQIVLSRWWLERYRFGPMEWLWRSLTYGRPQPMRPER